MLIVIFSFFKHLICCNFLKFLYRLMFIYMNSYKQRRSKPRPINVCC